MCKKIKFQIEDKAVEVLKAYGTNGRDAVNIIQIAAGIALNEQRQSIHCADIEWVINFSQYNPRLEKKIPEQPQVGFVNGLVVHGGKRGNDYGDRGFWKQHLTPMERER